MNKISIDNLLDLARQSPSGDNLQPWHFFSSKDNCLTLEFKPSPIKEPEYYVTGVYSSMGMMIEYVKIAANSLGFKCQLDINQDFDPEKNKLVATFYFSPDNRLKNEIENNKLVEAMRSRHTSRQAYSKDPISQADLDDLSLNLSDYTAKIKWITNKTEKSKVAKALSLSDNFFWCYSPTRNALVESIYKTNKHPKRKFGMPTSTLGAGLLEPVIKNYFLLAQRFPILWHSIRFKASADSVNNIAASGAIGFIHIKTNQSESWTGYEHVLGGMATARLWLEVTNRNLLLQPIYHLVAMKAHKGSNKFGPLFNKYNPKVVSLIDSLYSEEQGSLVFAFRLGHPKKKTPVSAPSTPRYSVNEILN